MSATCVFQEGDSQTLRIPKEMRTNKKDFYIHKIGDAYIAFPTDDPWWPTRQFAGTFPEDFMTDREQPSWDDVPLRDFNQETVSALQEAERLAHDPDTRRYSDVEDALRELKRPLGIADGKVTISDDLNRDNAEIAAMFRIGL
ncbi:MAG: hypothetical protein IJU98_06950 [Synergistaceae bacterium]|nr:hypothetical protein [Synergistaceae bacterium]